jgi:hypothetical protein
MLVLLLTAPGRRFPTPQDLLARSSLEVNLLAGSLLEVASREMGVALSEGQLRQGCAAAAEAIHKGGLVPPSGCAPRHAAAASCPCPPAQKAPRQRRMLGSGGRGGPSSCRSPPRLRKGVLCISILLCCAALRSGGPRHAADGRPVGTQPLGGLPPGSARRHVPPDSGAHRPVAAGRQQGLVAERMLAAELRASPQAGMLERQLSPPLLPFSWPPLRPTRVPSGARYGRR